MTGPLLWGESRPGDLDPSSPPVGTEGTVTWVSTWTDFLTQQFSVEWDNGVHGPPAILGSDPYEIIERSVHVSGPDRIKPRHYTDDDHQAWSDT